MKFPNTPKTILATGLALIGMLSGVSGQIPSGSSASLVLGQADFDSDVSLDPPTAASLRIPRNVSIHAASGKVFVLDDLNNRVLRYASAATLANGAAAEWVFGQPDFTSAAANQGGTAQAFTLNRPGFVLVDPSGRLWISDQTNNRVLSIENAVNRTDQNPSADKVLGNTTFTSSSSGSAPNQFASPAGLFFDPTGSLWVADALNHRILRFDDATAKANGAVADGLIGISGSPGTSRTQFNTPIGLVVDSQGTLWVADLLNNRVLGFDNAATLGAGSPATRLLGQLAFTTNTAGSNPKMLSGPAGLTIDLRNALWISDRSNNRVLRFDGVDALIYDVAASAVLGQPDFFSNGSGVSATNLNFPGHPFADSLGNLWVADVSNDRVLRFGSAIAPPAPEPAPPTLTLTGKSSIRTNRARVVLRGTSVADAGIARIEFKAGKGGFKQARGTTSWRAVVRLPKTAKGAVVRLRAIDELGQRSKVERVRVIRR